MKVSRIKDVQMNVVGMQGKWRQQKMLACKVEIYTIWKSNLFMKMILEMPEKYQRGESKNSVFRNLNNNQIYEKLMEAKEETSTKKDYIMQFVIATYYTLARVIGYMNPGKKTMFVNKRYFDNFSRKKVGSNGSHEYAHTLGGRHSGPDLRLSVMYYLNYVYETCYEHFFEKGLTDIDFDIDLGTNMTQLRLKFQKFQRRNRGNIERNVAEIFGHFGKKLVIEFMTFKESL